MGTAQSSVRRYNLYLINILATFQNSSSLLSTIQPKLTLSILWVTKIHFVFPAIYTVYLYFQNNNDVNINWSIGKLSLKSWRNFILYVWCRTVSVRPLPTDMGQKPSGQIFVILSMSMKGIVLLVVASDKSKSKTLQSMKTQKNPSHHTIPMMVASIIDTSHAFPYF